MDYTDQQLVTQELENKQKQLQIRAAQLSLVRQLIQRQKTGQQTPLNLPPLLLKNSDSDETCETAEKRVQGYKGGGGGVGGKRQAQIEQGQGQGQINKKVCVGVGKQSSELFDQVVKLVKRIRSHSDARLFRESVDPVRYCCPEYYDIIKRPMDLGTMLQKLNEGRYQTVWQVKSDLDLIWSNCFLFNGIESPVGQKGRKLQQYADNLWDKFVAQNGLMQESPDKIQIEKTKPVSVFKQQENKFIKALKQSQIQPNKRYGQTTIVEDDDVFIPVASTSKQQPKKQKNAILSDDEDDDCSHRSNVARKTQPNLKQIKQQKLSILSQQRQSHVVMIPSRSSKVQQSQFMGSDKRQLQQNTISPASNGILSDNVTREQLQSWIQQNFDKLQEDDHVQLAKCLDIQQSHGEQEEADLDLETCSLKQLKAAQKFIKKRIVGYRLKISQNKEYKSAGSSGDGSSEEVTSNQQTNMEGNDLIKGRSPFISQAPTLSKDSRDTQSAKIIKMDSSLWKNLGNEEDANVNTQDNTDNQLQRKQNNCDDSCSGDEDDNEEEQEEDDIWSEFRTKDELQQAQKRAVEAERERKVANLQRTQDQQRKIEEESSQSQKMFIQAKIDREIQDLDKYAFGGSSMSSRPSSNSQVSPCNMRVTPMKGTSTDLLTIGLVRKKSVHNDCEEEYL
eukprot:TRINITY_DN2309_c0_g1_i1.p1 TRINITY_DN2309_c0_g1~~TRINITY_DN2309_c0_g1_i1.p1  ORF type:complete len:675 (-),score=118.72 TRINITY_DN2309_c0_g1_i1:446-2470(-)